MISLGRTERRVVLAILVTAALPLLGSVGLATTLLRRVVSTAFQPEFAQQLEQSVGVYKQIVTSTKARMRAQARAIVAEQRPRWRELEQQLMNSLAEKKVLARNAR